MDEETIMEFLDILDDLDVDFDDLGLDPEDFDDLDVDDLNDILAALSELEEDEED